METISQSNVGQDTKAEKFSNLQKDDLYSKIYGSANYIELKSDDVEETFCANEGAPICQSSELGSESGVEPDYTEWIFEEPASEEDILMDMTSEQAMAALRYFTSTAGRTNMMAKAHSSDLDMISNILSDKEKDLEMAAKIGQSLLQRNKQLMVKIEKIEDYLSETKENEKQLQHDLQMKKELVKLYFEDDDKRSETSLNGSRDGSCHDEDLMLLERRCRSLERDNQQLFSDAMNLRDLTNHAEEQEESLVFDCIEQLSSAKHQITNLTDEIAQKFEDNMQQQEEITQLIHMVVELQKKQKQLSVENEDLQLQLIESNTDKDSLQDELAEMRQKYLYTQEMLQENQDELKDLKSRLETNSTTDDWLSDSSNSIIMQDSLANEIERSVRRDLLLTHEKRKCTQRTLESVRHLNTRPFDYSSTSGRSSPVSNWSLASDERSDVPSALDGENIRYAKRPAKRLQIVKPMEGSDTLNKWHHLASQNVTGGLSMSESEGTVERAPVPAARKSASKVASITPKKSLFADLDTTADKRTIITRTSSALTSIRRGRKLLHEEEGKSKSEVIDMIANAMSKVNVEARTGQRILRSLSISQSKSSVNDSPKAAYKDMPNVTRALTKAAERRTSEMNDSPRKKAEHIEVDGETTKEPAVNCSKEKESPSKSPLEQRSESIELDSVSGPLGMVNRADDSRLMRFSHGKDLPPTNSLAGMMMNNSMFRGKTLGMGSLINKRDIFCSQSKLPQEPPVDQPEIADTANGGLLSFLGRFS